MARFSYPDNSTTAPVWAGDWLDREHLVPGGAKVLASAFNVNSAVVVTTSAQASANATSISVTALSGAIPTGTILYFGETGELARLSANAAAGATSLSVDAIPAQIESGDTATYTGTSALKTIASGTLIGRTFTERASGTAFGPADASDDEIYLVAFDVADAAINNDVELYRYGSIVKENLLPQWSTLSSGLKAALRSRYQTTVGVA